MEIRSFNQTTLAEKTGTTQSTIYRWLSGTQPRTRALDELCNALRVRKAWLLYGEEPMDTEGREIVLSDAGAKSNDDPVRRLLRDLDFASLCGVAEASLAKLRHAGKVQPVELKHLSQAVEEMHRRS